MEDTPAVPHRTDHAAARAHMVDSQVRPNKVVDPRIIEAMRRLPRERFVPPGLSSLAYADEDVPLPGGRALLEPMVIARLAQILRVRPGETALVVGAGAGYGAAVLDACGATVTALEDDAMLLALARAALPALAPGVTLAEGPVAAGWASGAPYDVILIEGAVEAIPDVLVAQLKPGGRMATVLAGPNEPGMGVLAEPVQVGGETRMRSQPIFNCAVPALPQFKRAPAFIF